MACAAYPIHKCDVVVSVKDNAVGSSLIFTGVGFLIKRDFRCSVTCSVRSLCIFCSGVNQITNLNGTLVPEHILTMENHKEKIILTGKHIRETTTDDGKTIRR